jgi:transcriptional regulator with XRE-family HTH domain
MTNQEVGELIGLSHSAVSRIRRGERNPSFDVMMKIDQKFDWPLEQQIVAKVEGYYATYFEGRLARSAAS